MKTKPNIERIEPATLTTPPVSFRPRPHIAAALDLLRARHGEDAVERFINQSIARYTPRPTRCRR